MASSKQSVPSFPIMLVFEQEIGRAHSARDAMMLVGENWDSRPAGEHVSGHYEFELDDHKFLIHVVPIDKLDPVDLAAREIFGLDEDHSVGV
jgi:hypothetical protein